MSITYSVQSHGEGNLSRGANLIQTLVLLVGVLCEAKHLSMEKNLAKKSQQRKAVGLINGCRQRQVNIYIYIYI